VRNELVNLELSIQVVIYETGELCAALDTAEGATFPDAAGDKLECYQGLLVTLQTEGKGNTYVSC
jgi:hypothetical protein